MATSFKRTVDIAVKVTGDTQASIAKIGNNLKTLSGIITTLQNSANVAVTSINNISAALGSAKDFKAPELSQFGTDIKTISKIDPKKIADLAVALKELQKLKVPTGLSSLVDSLIKLGTAVKPPDYTKFIEAISSLGSIGKFPSLVSFVNQVGKLTDLGAPPDITKFANGLAALGKIKDLPSIPRELVENIQALAGLKSAPNLTAFAKGLEELKKVRITESQISFLAKLAPALQGLSGVKSGPNLTTFAEGLKKFAEVSIKPTQVSTIAQLAPALQAFSGLKIPSIDKFIASLEKLGGMQIPSLTKITQEIDRLAASFAKLTSSSPLIATLNRIGQSSEQVATQIGTTTKATNSADSAFGRFGDRIKNYFSYRVIADSVIAMKEYFTGALTAITEYSQGLKDLQAITLSTDSAVADMAITIQRVASTTKFSTTEVAEGMKILAQAGLSSNEAILSMEAVSNLATGTLSTMATTVDLVTTAMRVFNIDASETGRLSDVFANAVNRSKLTIEKLRIAMNYVGPVAASVGISVEETSAAMMTLANSGLRASTIGTGLRRVLSELASPSIKLARAAERAGVDLRSLDPTAHSLSDVFTTLGLVINDAGTAFDIFGKRGAASALAITNNVATSFDDTVATVSKFGTAAEMAQIQMEGLGISFKNLQDKIALVSVAMGEAGLIDVLKYIIDTSRDLADSLESLVRRPGALFVGWAAASAVALTGIWRGGTRVLTFFKALEGAAVAVSGAQTQAAISEEAYNVVKARGMAVDTATLAVARARIANDKVLQAAMAKQATLQATVTGLRTAENVNTGALAIAEGELAVAKSAVAAATERNIVNSYGSTTATVAQVTATDALIIAETELASANVAVATTSKAMWYTNPIYWFIAAVIAAIAIITLWKSGLEENIRTFRKLNEEINATKQSLQGYIKELRDMNELPINEEERLGYLNKLAAKYPKIATEIYKAGNSAEGLAATLAKYDKQLDIENQANLVRGMQNFGESARKTRTEINELTAQMQSYRVAVAEGVRASYDSNPDSIKLGELLAKEAEDVRLGADAIIASGKDISKVDWASFFKVDQDAVESQYGDLKAKIIDRVQAINEATIDASITAGTAFFGLAGKWKRDMDKSSDVVGEFVAGTAESQAKVADILAKADKGRAESFISARKALTDEMSDAENIYNSLEKPTTEQAQALFATSRDIAERSAALMKEYSGQMGLYYITEAAALNKWYQEKKATLGALDKDTVAHYKLEEEFAIRQQRILVGMSNEKLSFENMTNENKEIESAFKQHLIKLKGLRATHELTERQYDDAKVSLTKTFYDGMATRATKFYDDLKVIRDKDPVTFTKAQELMLSLTESFEDAKTAVVALQSKRRIEIIDDEVTSSTSKMQSAYSSRLRAIAISEAKNTLTHEQAEREKLQATLDRYDEEVRIAKNAFKMVTEDEKLKEGDSEYKKYYKEYQKVLSDVEEERAELTADHTANMYKATTKLKENLTARSDEEQKNASLIVAITAKKTTDVAALELDQDQKILANKSTYLTALKDLDEKREKSAKDLRAKIKDIEDDANKQILSSMDALRNAERAYSQRYMSEAEKSADDLSTAYTKLKGAEAALETASKNNDKAALERVKEIIAETKKIYEDSGSEEVRVNGLTQIQKLTERAINVEANIKKTKAKEEWDAQKKKIDYAEDAAKEKFKNDEARRIIDEAQAMASIVDRATTASNLEDARHKKAMRDLDLEAVQYLKRYLVEKQLRDSIDQGSSKEEQQAIVDVGTNTGAAKPADGVEETVDGIIKAQKEKAKLSEPTKVEVDVSALVTLRNMLGALKNDLTNEQQLKLAVAIQDGEEVTDSLLKSIGIIEDKIAKKVVTAYEAASTQFDLQKQDVKTQLDEVTSDLETREREGSPTKDPVVGNNIVSETIGDDIEQLKNDVASLDEVTGEVTKKVKNAYVGMVQSGIYEALTSWADGAKSFNDSITDMAADFVASLADMVAQMLVYEAVAQGLAAMGFNVGGANTITGKAYTSKAEGGLLRGPGTGTSDSILANVSNGEYVMTAKQTSNWLPALEAMRQGKFGQWLSSLQGYARGGLVTHVPKTPNFAKGGLVAGQGAQGGTSNNVAVTVNLGASSGGTSGGTDSDNTEITGNSAYIKKFGRILSDMVTKEILEQQRPGGLLYG